MLIAAAAALLLVLERSFGGGAWLGMKQGGGYTDVALTGVAQGYPQAIAQADYHLNSVTERARSMSGDWLMHNLTARAWYARARLSGSYDDHAAARSALERAFAVAFPGTGPHLTGAAIAFSMHRLTEAERYLDAIDRYAVPPDEDERAEIAAMRGDIAFYRGNYDQALAAYGRADRLVPGTSDFRRAIYHSRTGKPDLAALYLQKAELGLRQPTRYGRSHIELQRGILKLDRGALDDAMAHFRRADRIFPGHWLIEEHMAEVLTLQGKLAKAEALYRDIVRRTGHPEFLDALAGIADQRGDIQARERLYAQAGALWARRLKLFPEASYAHALEHCIARGNWKCAEALARRNVLARPYGEAKIGLARALLGSGQKAAAQAALKDVVASSWRTPELEMIITDIRNVHQPFIADIQASSSLR